MKSLLKVLIIVYALCSIYVWSQAEDSEGLYTLCEIPEITTASKKSEKSIVSPATVCVLTQKDIILRGYINLKDVLRDLPGMETVENYFSEIGTLIPVRGAIGNNKIIFLVNGMRVNPPGGEEMMIRSDFCVRSVKQIEIIYGPGSTLYGADAISAIINIIIDNDSEQKNEQQFIATYGSNNYKNGYLNLKNKFEKINFQSFFQYIDSDLSDISKTFPSYWNYYKDVLTPMGIELKPKRWDKGNNFFCKIEDLNNNSFQIWRRESSRSSAEGGYAPILQYVEEAKWHDISTVMELQNEIKLSDNKKLKTTLNYNKYEIDPETRYVWPSSSTELFYNDFKYGMGYSINLESMFTFEINENLVLISGVNVSYFNIIPKCTIPDGADTDENIVNQAGYFTYYNEIQNSNSRVDITRANNIKYKNFSAYIESHYKIRDDFNIIAGIRMDHNTRYDSNPFSPRFSAIYNLNDSLTIKYIFTKAFISPPPYFGYNIFDNGVFLNISNPELKPETTLGNEINLNFVKDIYSVDLSFYYNKFSNFLIMGDKGLPINIVKDKVYMDLDGISKRILTHSSNSGDGHTQGVDIFGKMELWNYLSVWSSYSYVDYKSKILGITSGLEQISQNIFKLGLSYKMIEKLIITPSIICKSTPKNFINYYGLKNEIKNPYEINTHMIYLLNEQLYFTFDIKNLTNHKYASKGVLSPIPQEPFSAYVGLSYTL